MNFNQISLLVFVCFIFSSLNAQFNTSTVEAAISGLDADPDMQSANWSICVKDAATGKTIIAHNEHRSLPTASTMKAITASTALAILGSNYQFSTYIEYSGAIKEGVLKGNIYIRGTGDPTLGSDRFEEPHRMDKLMLSWANAIKERGINEIQGKVIGDANAYSSQLTPGNWGWEDMGNYYGAGAAGLNIHENKYRLDFNPGTYTGGQTKVIRTDPYIHGLEFINEVRTGAPGSGDNAYIYGAPYSYVRYLRGTVPPGRYFAIHGSIPDPALFCAQKLEEVLDSCGVSALGSSTIRLEKIAGNAHNAKRMTIVEHKSPTLAEIIKPLNMKSINLFAEALLNHLAFAKGKKGTTENGAKIVEDYWKSKGLNTRGFFMRDGSGLSSNNGMSTHHMSFILAQAYQAATKEDFYHSLPLAGRSGSLKGMLRGTRAENNLRAKSGYIAGVRSYTGYVDTRSDKRLSFAIIAHNFSCTPGRMRQKLSRLMASLAEIP